jgi:protocatechuate 3,4-dioxygenase beta subunit
MDIQTNRRRFLFSSAALASLATKAFAFDSCDITTPTQTSGPFYPGETNFSMSNDLTQIPGKPGRALGQVIYVRGKVLDHNCRPVVGATVEIWQACATGKYNSSKDPNPAKIDPNFKYWTEAVTDKNGEYLFKTIKPGAYPADEHWDRPPHIHFKVSKLGYKELITQMYFKGEPLNDPDLILREIPQAERGTVIVGFTYPVSGRI